MGQEPPLLSAFGGVGPRKKAAYHLYHPPCSVVVWDCTIDQLHAPIVYEHQKVMKLELSVF